MKNHIIESIIETAKYPINTMGIAAMEQIMTEVVSEFPGAEATAFSFHGTLPGKSEPHYSYYVHAELIDPWPLERKGFCGNGNTVVEAMESLRKELKAYFMPANGFVLEGIDVLNHKGEPIPDRRTEFAA